MYFEWIIFSTASKYGLMLGLSGSASSLKNGMVFIGREELEECLTLQDILEFGMLEVMFIRLLMPYDFLLTGTVEIYSNLFVFNSQRQYS